LAAHCKSSLVATAIFMRKHDQNHMRARFHISILNRQRRNKTEPLLSLTVKSMTVVIILSMPSQPVIRRNPTRRCMSNVFKRSRIYQCRISISKVCTYLSLIHLLLEPTSTGLPRS
jgi:hypothetical protein